MSDTKKNDHADESAELIDEQLEDASGGAETVHLYLKSNGADIQGESSQAVFDPNDTRRKVKP